MCLNWCRWNRHAARHGRCGGVAAARERHERTARRGESVEGYRAGRGAPLPTTLVGFKVKDVRPVATGFTVSVA